MRVDGRPSRLAIGTYGSIQTTELARGRFRALTRFRDWDGQTRQVGATGESRNAAITALKLDLQERMRHAGTQGSLAPDSKFTDLADAWLDDLRLDVDRAESTKETHERQLRGSVLPFFADFAVREITVGRIERYLKQQRLRSFSMAKHSKTTLSMCWPSACGYRDAANAQIWQMTAAWATGRGKRHFPFDEDDPFTHLFRSGENASLGIEEVKRALRAGLPAGAQGEVYVNVTADHPTWIIRDAAIIAGAGNSGNLTDAFIGSYELDFKVESVNGNRASVEMAATNPTLSDSFTRLPYYGGNFQPIYIPMQIANDHFGSWETITQTMTWREELEF